MDIIVDNVSKALQKMVDRKEFKLRVEDVSKLFDAIRWAWG